jgi:hypothetical protein
MLSLACTEIDRDKEHQKHIYIYIYIKHLTRVIKMCIGIWWRSLRERDRWGDRGVDGRIILGWMFKKWDVGVRTGLGWLRIGTGGGRL